MDPSQLTEEQRKQLEEKLKNMSPEELREFQKQQCIFCQIVNGKIPSKKVYEDNFCIAVLDINPAAKGHMLVIPKEHYAIMPQVDDDTLGHLFMISRHLSQILLKIMKSEGTNIFIANGPAAGQRAQHFMIHLIPRKDGDGILELEEKLITSEMVGKIKSAVQEKLDQILGLGESKKEKPKKIAGEEIMEKPEHFITSATAKRFHKEKCAFAQNIPEDKKIIMDKQEAFESEKEPCTCVTGKRIPLKKEKIGSKKVEETESKPATSRKEKKSQKSKKDHEEEKEDGEEKEGDVSLDDIADLFK